jgi:hypothetical protein
MTPAQSRLRRPQRSHHRSRVMRLAHETVIVLSSLAFDSDYHSWTDSDRKSIRKFGLIRTEKTADLLGDLRWLALKYFNRLVLNDCLVHDGATSR